MIIYSSPEKGNILPTIRSGHGSIPAYLPYLGKCLALSYKRLIMIVRPATGLQRAYDNRLTCPSCRDFTFRSSLSRPDVRHDTLKLERRGRSLCYRRKKKRPSVRST